MFLRAGHSYNDTSRRFDLPLSLLRREFPGLGYKGQRKPHPSEEQLAEARGLFAQGLSRVDVHRITGISIFFLSKYFPNNKWTQEEVTIYAKARKMENQIDNVLKTV